MLRNSSLHNNGIVTCQYNLTDLHHIFYDRSPSGKVVRVLLGTIASGWFTGEETRLERKAQEEIKQDSRRCHNQKKLRVNNQHYVSLRKVLKNSSTINCHQKQFCFPPLYIPRWWWGLPVLSSSRWTLVGPRSLHAGWVCSSSRSLFLFTHTPSKYK